MAEPEQILVVEDDRDIAELLVEVLSQQGYSVDLSEAVDALDPEDRVAFTPTLVRRSPPPRAWLLGDLRDHTALRSLLDDAGVARRTT